jgi:hypothetical protein
MTSPPKGGRQRRLVGDALGQRQDRGHDGHDDDDEREGDGQPHLPTEEAFSYQH